MRKRLLVWMLVLTACSLIAQDAPPVGGQEEGVPENVKISLDALLTTRTSNQEFGLKFLESYFFALQTAPAKVYANVLFKGELDQDATVLREKMADAHKQRLEKYNAMVDQKQKELAEENARIELENRSLQKDKQKPLKTWEKPPAPVLSYPDHTHNLFLRVVQNGQILQRFKSPIPFDDKETEYYSFGLILEPGKYDILINVSRLDNTKDGTLLIELDVPDLTLGSLVKPMDTLVLAQPVFYREMRNAMEVESRFTVLKNKYQVGKQIFYPYVGTDPTFKTGENPILTFFIQGAAQMVNNQPQWELTPKLEIKQNKKSVVIFKVETIRSPYFFQALSFVVNQKPLDPGDYVLSVELQDTRKKGSKTALDIPFKLVE